MNDPIRHRLRLAAARPDEHRDPPDDGTRRRLAARVVLDRVVLLFNAYGLRATAGRQTSNVESWRFYLGQRVVSVTDLPRQSGGMSGQLEQRIAGERAAGALTQAPVAVAICELVWDPADGCWWGAQGESAIDAVLSGILDALE